jgi:hypothetical protein
MGKLTLICLGIVLSPPAFAQSASNFDPKISAPSKPLAGSKDAAKPAPLKPGTLDLTPSRLIGPGEIASYLNSISSNLLIKKRKRDPFGMFQDLAAAPVAKTTSLMGANPIPVIRTTPFRDIVRLIKVTTVMPREKKFLLGSRSFGQGDMIPLKYKGKALRVQITEVGSQQISFRNLDTGETASLGSDREPAGMTRGDQGASIPGLTPNQPNAPIDLDAGDSAP